jgi:hypothetical protein
MMCSALKTKQQNGGINQTRTTVKMTPAKAGLRCGVSGEKNSSNKRVA